MIMKKKPRYIILTPVIVILLAILACSMPGSSGSEPSISVLAPLQGSTFGVGETIIISFRSEGSPTIARVEMSLEGTLIATQEGGSSPFEGAFMWTPQDPGSYNLILTAYDPDGETSPPVGVSVIVEALIEAVEVESSLEEPDVSEESDVPEETEPAETVKPTPQAEQAHPEPAEPSEIVQPIAPFYITDGGYFDFDNASGIHGGAVVYDQPDPALPEITFYNDRITSYELGLFGLWGDTLPTFEECRSAAISDVEIPTKHLLPGTTICFQTDLGNFGYFLVEDRYKDQYGDLVLGFDYALWDPNGSEIPVGQALHTISGTTYPQGIKGKDLDFYRNVQMVDITFEAVSDSLINIVPSAGAQIAIFGSDIPTYQDCADLALDSQPVPVELEPVPDVAPVKAANFVCFRTDEGRLGRLYLKWVYLGSLSAPLPYGDPWAHADFMIVYEGDGILVEYYADTWALPEATPPGLIPQRAADGVESGRIVLPFGDTIDFDLGTSLDDPRAIPDLEFLADENTAQAHLAPWHETVFQSAWGDSPPSYQDCQSANLSNAPINLEIGKYVCFQTSTGRIGSYKVNDFYFDVDNYLYGSAAFFVDLSYTLWAVDGQMVIVHQPAVHVLRSAEEWLQPGAYDLDMELGAIIEDMIFEAISSDQVQLIPAPDVELAYWGLTLPNYQDCVSLPRANEAQTVEVIDVQNFEIPGYKKLSIPAFFCYQTDEGRLGRLEFEGVYENTDAGQTYLLISAESWHLEGDPFQAGEPESIPESSQEPAEEMSEEFIPDEYGVIKSGEVWLPNFSAYDFISENIDQTDFNAGDVIIEYSPENLDGCTGSMFEPGGTMLGPIPDELTSIDVRQVGGFNTGCLPIELGGVYVLIRQTQPGDYVIFRVTAFDADGVTLEYIVGVYP